MKRQDVGDHCKAEVARQSAETPVAISAANAVMLAVTSVDVLVATLAADAATLAAMSVGLPMPIAAGNAATQVAGLVTSNSPPIGRVS